MTTPFDRPLVGFRFVEVRRGDTLQAIAAREMGDATRWHEIISYNRLVPPYVTDDEAEAGPGVVLAGGMLMVPAPAAVTVATDPEQVFERDAELRSGQLVVGDDGDLRVVSGRDNLRQAIRNRIETDRGEIIFHPAYGSQIRQLLGTVNGPTAGLLAAQYARTAVESDPRIQRVTQSVAEVAGDVVRVSVEAEPIVGRPVDAAATV